MKKLLLLIMVMLYAHITYSQYTIKLSIQTAEGKMPLAGATATIVPINKTSIADSLGMIAFTNIAKGVYNIKISYIGFEEKTINLNVPNESIVTILLDEAEDHEDDVVVTATRTSRTISDIPTRVETMSGEELEEKANMKPGDIRMMLSESTGIQTQQQTARRSV